TRDDPKDVAARHDLAMSHHHLGALCARHGRYFEAEKQHGEATHLFRDLASKRRAVPEYRQMLAASLHSLAEVLAATSRPRDAEELHKQALAVRQALADEYPSVP